MPGCLRALDVIHYGRVNDDQGRGIKVGVGAVVDRGMPEALSTWWRFAVTGYIENRLYLVRVERLLTSFPSTRP